MNIYQKQPPIIIADTLSDLSQKVMMARKRGQSPRGKPQRYIDNRVIGYYQVMEMAQVSIFDAYSA